jgi:hypothetical protein
MRSISGGTSKTPIFNAFCSPDIDENSKNSKKRSVKQFVKTKIGNNVQYGLCNLASKIKRDVLINAMKSRCLEMTE